MQKTNLPLISVFLSTVVPQCHPYTSCYYRVTPGPLEGSEGPGPLEGSESPGPLEDVWGSRAWVSAIEHGCRGFLLQEGMGSSLL